MNTEVGGGRISHTSVANTGGKFGVPISQHVEILSAFGKYPWLVGLHSHVGSQGCGFELLVEAVKRLAALSQAIEERRGGN